MCMYLMNSGLEFLVQDLHSKYLPSANEVWGQGNAFTPVCLFAGRGSAPRGSASKGGLHPEEVFIQGSLYLRGFCIKGGLHPRKACIQGDLHSLGLGSPPNKVCINGGWADPPSPGILRETVNQRAVRILLECSLVVWINWRFPLARRNTWF